MPFGTSDIEKLNTMFLRIPAEKIAGAIWILPVRCLSVSTRR